MKHQPARHHSPPPAPRSGVASVTTLDPPDRSRGGDQVGVAAVQGALALDLSRAATVRRREQRASLTVMPSSGPQMERFARYFANVVVEVLSGDRNLQQLLAWTSEPVYAELARRVSLLRRTTPADQRIRMVRTRVRSVHLSRPTPTAAELSMRIGQGQRSRAIAARLDLLEGRWICTALEIG